MIDLSESEKDFIKRVFQKAVPDCKVVVFGSRIRGKANKFSDVDIAIKCGNRIPEDVMSQLREQFATSDLSVIVDIVDYHSVSDTFKKIIDHQNERLI